MNHDDKWIQLVFITDSANAEILALRLEEAGATAVSLLDAADQALFDTGQEGNSLWDQTRLIALFPATADLEVVLNNLRQKVEQLPPHEIIPLPDQDWEHSWMSRFKPMQFGKRLWVCPSWETPPDPDAINLTLDPGMAFGTGTHETTSLCLHWLSENRASLTGKSLIDYGCGSGILAIAAARLGADSVWAVDIEQQALERTRENAKANSVLEKLIISHPDQSQKIGADLLIANILANPLIALAPLFADYTKPDGRILLSGILRNQVPEILEAYYPFYTFLEPIYANEWVLLEGIRKSQ